MNEIQSKELQKIIGKIKPVDRDAIDRAVQKWNLLAKPLGSLGLLEDAISRIAGIRSDTDVYLADPVLLVFCADNKVVSRGISQSNHKVTEAVARALGAGESTVNYLAKRSECRVIPINVGMMSAGPFSGVEEALVKQAADDISIGPAMSRFEAEEAVLVGVRAVQKQVKQGADLILLGEMGIGNTTSTAAVSAALLGMSAKEMTGKGAGLSEEGFQKKVRVVEETIRVNRPDGKDPLDVISKVGGLDIAAMCGACLAGAYLRVPVVLDGVISCAAALCAKGLCPEVTDYLLASHTSKEPAAVGLLDRLGLHAPIQGELRLGEGTGAVLWLALVRPVLDLYQSGHTFDKLGMDAYVPL